MSPAMFRSREEPQPGAVRAAALVVAVWIGSEFLIRSVGIAVALLALGWRPPEEPSYRAVGFLNAGLQWPALAVPLAVTLRRCRREGLTWRAMGYRLSWQLAALGTLAGLAIGALTDFAAAPLDERLFPQRGAELVIQGIAAAGIPGAALLLGGNGLLGPLAEEFVWRGYVQTLLCRAWRPWTAVTVTALLFAVKHIIVDLSLDRTTTLVAISFLLGILARRWGTFASTAAHISMNMTATIQVLLLLM